MLRQKLARMSFLSGFGSRPKQVVTHSADAAPRTVDLFPSQACLHEFHHACILDQGLPALRAVLHSAIICRCCGLNQGNVASVLLL